MTPYDFHRGTLPLLISIPHAGTAVPDSIRDRLTPIGRELPDTDWYVDQLYAFAQRMGASVIKANYSRYVVDLNRAPDSSSLYAANPTSPVCPTLTFADEAIYERGAEPDEREIQARIEQYWQPYHQRITDELARIRSGNEITLLWDAHSIAGEVPVLFEGRLPDFNLGSRDNASCPPAVAQSLLQSIRGDAAYSSVLNGRFKGGYITMAYGQPAKGVWAMQLELAQRTYMQETPAGPWDAARAQPVMERIEMLVRQFLSLARS